MTFNEFLLVEDINQLNKAVTEDNMEDTISLVNNINQNMMDNEITINEGIFPMEPELINEFDEKCLLYVLQNLNFYDTLEGMSEAVRLYITKTRYQAGTDASQRIFTVDLVFNFVKNNIQLIAQCTFDIVNFINQFFIAEKNENYKNEFLTLLKSEMNK